MNKLFYYLSLKWAKDLKIAYDKRRNRKRTAYCENLWDMKLRGRE